jgi:hypothetical protein
MNPNPSRKILIDTDTASDDAIALIMALRSPDVSVLAITVVAGNVCAEQGTRNALFTTELCGSAVPVFTGAASPLERKLEDASWFHGQDGLGDHGYQPAARLAQDEFAVDAMVRIIRAQSWLRADHPRTVDQFGVSPSPMAPTGGERKPLRGYGWSTLLRGQCDSCRGI